MRFNLIILLFLISALLSQKEYNDVVIIYSDDESYDLLYEKYSYYPYPRGKVWGKAIENISMLGAKVIVIDHVFDTPDFSTEIKYLARDEMLKGKYSTIKEKEALENTFPIEDEDQLLADAILKAKENGTEVIFSAKINYDPNSTDPYSVLYPSATISNDKLKNINFGINQQSFTYLPNKYPISFKKSNSEECYHSLAIKALLSYYDINASCDYKNNQRFFYHNSLKNIKNPLINYSLSQVLDDDKTCLGQCVWDEDGKIYVPDNELNEVDDDWVSMMQWTGNQVFKDKIVVLGSSLPEDYALESVNTHANVIQELINKNYIIFFKDK